MAECTDADKLVAVDTFRNELMDRFIDMCDGNDYNKLTLLQIGDVIDRTYDYFTECLTKEYNDD